MRGGGRVSDEEMLARTRGLMAPGAAGIVYGRNVIQHPDPAGHDARADGGRARMSGAVRFGIIGGGLMGREFACAAARWLHLADIDVRPEIVHVCDANARRARAGTSGSTRRRGSRPTTASCSTTRTVEAVYCAVPHHLHAEVYVDILRAGRHLLGEKPFGIDLAANKRDHGRASPSTRSSSCAARRSCRSSPAARRSGAGSPSAASAA